MEDVIDLYKVKVARMNNEELGLEIKIHLIAMGQGLITPELKHRITLLLNEGLLRPIMEPNHDDFNITLRILKLL